MQQERIPHGLCQCGCGEATALARDNSVRYGYVKGKPVHYVAGHNNRGKATQPLTRFLRYVEFADDGCWLWQGGLSSGYGRFFDGKRTPYAHRWMYEYERGPVPNGLHLDHLCRTPACVNPAHLEPVTIAENSRRGLKGVLRTHCTHGHPWIPENLYVTPSGHRQCRLCKRERRARLRAMGITPT